MDRSEDRPAPDTPDWPGPRATYLIATVTCLGLLGLGVLLFGRIRDLAVYTMVIAALGIAVNTGMMIATRRRAGRR